MLMFTRIYLRFKPIVAMQPLTFVITFRLFVCCLCKTRVRWDKTAKASIAQVAVISQDSLHDKQCHV